MDAIPPSNFEEMFRQDCYTAKDIKNAADLVQQMLRWVPKDRIDCKQALKHAFLKQ